MNFLNFLTAGASLFNFNLQNLASSSLFNQELATAQIQNKDSFSQGVLSGALSEQETIQMKQEMQLITQKQQLINQYMHMNIQLLNQKLQNLQKLPNIINQPEKEKEKSRQGLQVKEAQEDYSEEAKNNRKKNKKINKCGHDDKQHYAKGLCNNCYHKYGRNKKPWKCTHEKLYAAGMCQNCYINNYNRKKRLQKDENVQAKLQDSIHQQQSSQRPENEFN